MTEGAWLALATFWPSMAVAYAMYRSTRISEFKERIELLEAKNRECDEKVRRLRDDNEWLMDLAQRHYGIRRPRWTEQEENGDGAK